MGAQCARRPLTRFRLSAVSESMLREKFRAYRAQPAKAADSLAKVKVGYFGKPFDRLIAEVTVIGMGASSACRPSRST